PAELRGATFIKVAPGERSSFYHAEQFGFVAVDTPERVQSGALSPDGMMRVSAGTFINGTYTTEAFGADVIDTDTWFISVQSEGGEPKGIARGYAPAFLDDTHVAYFVTRGVVVHDLSTSSSTLVYLFPENTVFSQVQYSPDRAHVLWTNPVTRESVLASITPTAVTPMKTFSGLDSPILRNSGVYELRLTEEGTEVWRSSFEEKSSARVLTIPASVGIFSMIP
ncbi:MAG: hypothetical protein AAB037_02040, partial [Chloroflexota bacterium]